MRDKERMNPAAHKRPSKHNLDIVSFKPWEIDQAQKVNRNNLLLINFLLLKITIYYKWPFRIIAHKKRNKT